MKDRIAYIIKSEALSNLQFAQIVGASPASVTHLLSGRNNPSVDMICKIARRFPHYNLRWLLLGEGKVYVSENGGGLAKSDIEDIQYELRTPISMQTTLFETPSDAAPKAEVDDEPSSAAATAPKSKATSSPQGAKLIVCLPDGTYQEYVKGN